MDEQQDSLPTQQEVEKWYMPLTRVTPLSKYLAMALFVTIPIAMLLLGYWYATTENIHIIEEETGVVEKISTDQWNEHSNSELGMVVSYPSTWTIEDEGSEIKLSGPLVDTPCWDDVCRPSLFLRVRETGNTLPVYTWFTEQSGLLILSKEFSQVAVGNRPAVLMDATEGVASPRYHYVANGEKIIEIGYQQGTVPFTTPDTYQKILDSIIFTSTSTPQSWHSYHEDDVNDKGLRLIFPAGWTLTGNLKDDGLLLRCDGQIQNGGCEAKDAWIRINNGPCTQPENTILKSLAVHGERYVVYCRNEYEVSTNNWYDPTVRYIITNIWNLAEPFGTKG